MKKKYYVFRYRNSDGEPGEGGGVAVLTDTEAKKILARMAPWGEGSEQPYYFYEMDPITAEEIHANVDSEPPEAQEAEAV